MVELISITEDGTDVDLADVRLSAAAPGMLARTNNKRWTCEWGGLEIELEHGFTAAEAEDFRQVVLAMVDQASLAVGTGAAGPLVSKSVDDVTMSWSSALAAAPMDKSVLDAYRLLAFG